MLWHVILITFTTLCAIAAFYASRYKKLWLTIFFIILTLAVGIVEYIVFCENLKHQSAIEYYNTNVKKRFAAIIQKFASHTPGRTDIESDIHTFHTVLDLYEWSGEDLFYPISSLTAAALLREKLAYYGSHSGKLLCIDEENKLEISFIQQGSILLMGGEDPPSCVRCTKIANEGDWEKARADYLKVYDWLQGFGAERIKESRYSSDLVRALSNVGNFFLCDDVLHDDKNAREKAQKSFALVSKVLETMPVEQTRLNRNKAKIRLLELLNTSSLSRL